jgi:hypothetical protein
VFNFITKKIIFINIKRKKMRELKIKTLKEKEIYKHYSTEYIMVSGSSASLILVFHAFHPQLDFF